MPYGIPNEKPEQTKWMEKCVTSVMGDNPDYKKDRAIAICKAQLKKNNWKVKKGEAELSMREELWDLEKKIREAIRGPVDAPVPSSGPWVADIFDDYIIVEKADKLFKVDWSMSGDDINVDWDTAVEVERKTVYEPVEGESEREVITKVPDVGKGKHRRITWGPTTI
jgi:hypothetical protein